MDTKKSSIRKGFGSVSNVSFSFREITTPERPFTVFSFHAIKAGMSMGIVNAVNLRFTKS